MCLFSEPQYTTTEAPKLPADAYSFVSQFKYPKNVFHAGKLRDAIDDLQDSKMPNVDLTVKKSKTKPFDLSAIDVGQSYQHVTFDHSSALKSTEDFDQTNVIPQSSPSQRPKLHFNQQIYHDINSMGNNKPKPYQSHSQSNFDDEDDEPQKPYKGFYLPKHYGKGQSGKTESLTTVNFDSKKLPKILKNNDDDEERNNPEDPVDAPIQIINGIPIANPYNIDLNTLK